MYDIEMHELVNWNAIAAGCDNMSTIAHFAEGDRVTPSTSAFNSPPPSTSPPR